MKKVFSKNHLLPALILMAGILVAVGFHFAPPEKKDGASLNLKLSAADFTAVSMAPQWSEKTGEAQSVPACNAADPMYSFNCVNGFPETTIYWNTCSVESYTHVYLDYYNSYSWLWTGTWSSCLGSHTFTADNATSYWFFNSYPSGHSQDSASFTTPQCIPPPPQCNIVANGSEGPVNISDGDSASVSWVGTNGPSCTVTKNGGPCNLSNGCTGASVSGYTGALSGPNNYDYRLDCSNLGGSCNDTVRVHAAAPLVTFLWNANPPSPVPYEGSSQIDWNAANAVGTCNSSWAGAGTPPSGSFNTGPLTSAQTYTITCNNADGVPGTSSFSMGVQERPRVSISADPIQVAFDKPSFLTWSSTDSVSCAASDDWSGVKPISGIKVSTGKLNQNRTYIFTITCYNSVGSPSLPDSAYVDVAADLVRMLWSVNPAPPIEYNGSAQICWNTVNVVGTCNSSWAGAGTPSNGCFNTGPLTSGQTYTLTCYNKDGVSRTGSVSINVRGRPSVSIFANPALVSYNTPSYLTWSSTNSYSCVASGDWNGPKTVSGNSVPTQNLTQNKQYVFSITCYNGVWFPSNTASAFVNVISPAAPRADIKGNSGSGPSDGPVYIASNSSASISWITSSAAPYTCLVERSTDAGSTWGACNLSGAGSCADLNNTGRSTGVIPGPAYYQYRLTCTNGDGWGNSTNERVLVNVAAPVTCSNGVDDDGDGLIDMADCGCTSGFDLSEDNFYTCDPKTGTCGCGQGTGFNRCGCNSGKLGQFCACAACSDGIDNDGDGKYDFYGYTDPSTGTYYPPDPGCTGPDDNSEIDMPKGFKEVPPE